MKKFVYIIISCLTVSTAIAQNEVESESKTVKATLFLNGAQVHRQARVNLRSGANLVKLTGLRRDINANSIIVEGSNSFNIVSVEQKVNYLKKTDELFEYKNLVSQRDKLKWEIRKIQADRTVLDEETNVLRANQEIKGREETMNVERLMDYSDIYNDKMVEITIKRNALDKKERESQLRMQNLNKQLQALEVTNNKATTEIWVTLNAPNSGNAVIAFSYYTGEARWSPFYDIRSGENNDNVNFVLKGRLTQSTGETWEKVNLTLSTGNPSLTSTLPALQPWTISSAKIVTTSNGSKKGKYKNVAKADAYSDDYEISAANEAPALSEVVVTEDEKLEVSYNQPIATMQNNLTTMEYVISEPYTLAGDNLEYDVDVTVKSAPGKKTFYTAPGYEEKAYTIVQVPEWHKLALLNGEAAMYYNDNYVGRTDIYTEGVKDTLPLTFGPDNNIIVMRKLIHSKDRNQVSGSNKVMNRTVEISLRNNKSKAAEVDITDQLPIAYNKSITVEKLELNGGTYNDKTGIVNWKVTLAPGETKKIVFSYRVKYPKNNTITKF